MIKRIKDHLEKRKDKKRRKEEKEDVLERLPGFVNSLMLLLRAGLVTDEAVSRLAGDGTDDSYFISGLYGIRKKMESTNSSFEREFRDFAGKSGIRELMRISGIITDNIDKGSSLAEKLDQEAEFMWHSMKKRTEEKGRLAESKMTFPIALMLISLIMVTAAPAFMTF